MMEPLIYLGQENACGRHPLFVMTAWGYNGPMTRGDVISHHDMCAAEGKMLQQGMNFRSGQAHSVILMSRRKGAPYPDRFSEDGLTLFYVGHDAYGHPEKTRIDQPLATQNATLTQNGKFFSAVAHSQNGASNETVHVYEKLLPGVWVFNGTFELVDAQQSTRWNKVRL